jgi:hypothetical protein
MEDAAFGTIERNIASYWDADMNREIEGGDLAPLRNAIQKRVAVFLEDVRQQEEAKDRGELPNA